MGRKISDTGEIALVMLGEIPAIGPWYRSRKKALSTVKSLLDAVDSLIYDSHSGPYQIMFERQDNGLNTLIIKNNHTHIEVFNHLDELFLKRFQKVFQNLLILSCFYKIGSRLECLAVTDGLGAVIYSAGGSRFFHTL